MNATVLLALVSTMKGVTFYQYNGWRFVPAPEQPSHMPFSVGVTSLAASIWDGRVVLGGLLMQFHNLVLIICEESVYELFPVLLPQV